MHWFKVVALVTLVTLLGAACGKDKPPTSAMPSSHASTEAQDALWKLAPDGATVGVVVSPTAVAAIENGWLAVKKLFATAPELAAIAAGLDAELTKTFGSSNVTLADVGMARGMGAALFMLPGGEQLVIAPVVDRDKFLAITKGTKGADADTFGAFTCKTVQDVYACAKPRDLLARIGKAPMAEAIRLAGARGDIEMAAVVNETSPTPIRVAAVGQLARGTLVLRGAAQGVPAKLTSKLVSSGKLAADASRTAGFAILKVGPVLADIPVPALPVVPGVTFADLAATIRDPQTTTIAPGTLAWDMRIPLSDPAPAQTFVTQCTAHPGLARSGATVTNGVCHVPLAPLATTLDVSVEANGLHMSTKDGAANATTIAPSPVASELLAGEWAFAMYGRGTAAGSTHLPATAFEQERDVVGMYLRSMMLLNELGVGVRADGDTIRFLVSVRTVWSNPDDVVAKLVAIPLEDIFQGKASAAAKQIADASPASPFATDYKVGFGGLLVPTSTIGMVAAVAIPAFMDYMKKSKKSEASIQLTALEKRLRAAAAADNALPKGKAPLTPATSCCGQPGNKCSDPAAWQHPVWQALDFSIDDPHLFRYSYESDGTTFKATAVTDLDCDGIEIAYVLTGSVDADGHVTSQLTPPQPNTD